MRVGYTRMSTDDRTLALREDALRQAGCDRIFTGVASGIDPPAGRSCRPIPIDQFLVTLWEASRAS
jgi:DNA invertase Pin-like site-specific DNA recombinase